MPENEVSNENLLLPTFPLTPLPRSRPPTAPLATPSLSRGSSAKTSRSPKVEVAYTEPDVDWDSDLEDSGKQSRPALPPPDDPARAQMIYLAACRQHDLVPCSAFLRSLRSGVAKAAYQGLGPLGARAVSLALVTNLTVTELQLQGNLLKEYGLRCVVEMLQENSTIKILDVSDNDLQSPGAVLLSSLLEENDSLTTLRASGNRFKESDAKYFADAIKNNGTLKVLDLSHNEFREDGGIFLGKGLGVNESLETVNISWNHLRLAGIRGVAAGIKENACIKVLDVSWNGIGNEGAKVIGKALKENKTLRDLDLSSCRIGLEGLTVLMKELTANDALKVLRLSHNPITTDGAVLAMKVLQAHPTMALEHFEMNDVSVPGEFLDVLKTIKQQRPWFVALIGGVMKARDAFMDALYKTKGPGPMEILSQYLLENNIRLVDLFANLDTDKSCAVTREEFAEGLQSAGIPLNAAQMAKLMDQLDSDGDGQIDFGELLDGYNKFVKLQARRERYMNEIARGAASRASKQGTTPLPDQSSPFPPPPPPPPERGPDPPPTKATPT